MMSDTNKTSKSSESWYSSWWGIPAIVIFFTSLVLIGSYYTNPPKYSASNAQVIQESESAENPDSVSSQVNTKEDEQIPETPTNQPLATSNNKQLDPRVTQDTIKTTVCISGYTKTVRPSTSYTGRIKSALMAKIGATKGSDYELDHYIPLALGGSSDPINLWLEPIAEAKEKDKLEVSLHNQVCAGLITLIQGQNKIREAYSIKQ